MRVIRVHLLISVCLIAASAFAQPLPTDPYPSCVASPQLFNSWFVSGSVSLNGPVNPANSLALNTTPNCNFYLWAEQMYLWLTSPAQSQYGTGLVFDSQVFYDVSTLQNGKRYFIPHVPLVTPNASASRKSLALRPGKPGPHGLPVVVDRKGRLIEIAPAPRAKSGRPMVLNSSGKNVEVSKVERGPDGKAIFFDASGKKIARPKTTLTAAQRKSGIAQMFFAANGHPLFVDGSGNVLDVDPGQATQDVLLAQDGSVIYYSIAANDVYAWFRTGVVNGAINTNNMFPTTQSDLNQVIAYAAKYGVTFPDPNALAIELKLSWVNAAHLPNPNDYITMSAEVPMYDTSDPAKWVYTGMGPMTLALIGIHVVGSANGHPELLWATFEHFGNTPNGTYQYLNTNQQPVTVNQSTAGTWLFSPANGSGTPNQSHATYKYAPDITAVSPYSVSASFTVREKAFGIASNVTPPNPVDATPAAANTELIALNNSVINQLISGDMRRNYYMIGETWTNGGVPPNGSYPGNEVGTPYLANSTMETYVMGTDTTSAGAANCFACHTSGASSTGKATTAVSHIFSKLQPLQITQTTSTTKKK